MLRKKCFKKFLAMSLCVLMVLGLGVSVGASNDDIPYIYASGAEAISFNPETTSYTLTVPYFNYGYEMPVIYAGEGATVSYPESVADGEIITVSKGDKTYTLTISTVGESMYQNTGFEGAFEDTWQAASCGIYPTNFNVASGIQSIIVTGTSASRYLNAYNRPQGEAGKTYLSSFMIRLASDIDFNVCGAQVPDDMRGPRVTQYTDTETFDNLKGSAYKWNEDGTARDKANGAASSPFTVTTQWQRVNATVVPSEATPLMHWLVNWSANRPAYVMDNYYVNELMVSRVNVKDENGNTSLSYATPQGEAETYSLNAEILNQLGNKAGVKNVTVSEWSIAGDLDATITSEGVLTVNSGASGEALVLAKVEFNGKTIYGVAPIYVGELKDETAVELFDIKAGSLSVPNFDPKKVEYDYAVPYKYVENNYYSIAVPTVTCYAKDEEATVNVTYPKAVKDGKITITVSKGELKKVYTLNLKPVGINYFLDGGFEEYKAPMDSSYTGSWYPSSQTGIATEKTNVYKGLQALKIKDNNAYSAGYYQNESYRPNGANPTTTAGHTYLVSGMFKPISDVSTHKWIYSSFTQLAASGRKCYDSNGNLQSGDNYLNTGDWMRTYGTYTTSESVTARYHYAFNASNGEGYVDEVYWGDLTVAELNYTGASNVIISGEAKDVALTAELKNAYGLGSGLENETVAFELVKPYEGVTISDNKLIIAKNAKAGKVLVRLNVTPTFQSAQTVISPKVSNVAEITLAEAFDQTSIKLSENTVKAGEVKATVNAINNTEEKLDLKLYIALYEKEEGAERLVAVEESTLSAEVGALLNGYAKITVPDNAQKEYFVKAFLWKDNAPALLNEKIVQETPAE